MVRFVNVWGMEDKAVPRSSRELDDCEGAVVVVVLSERKEVMCFDGR